jgi:hypothetical protein
VKWLGAPLAVALSLAATAACGKPATVPACRIAPLGDFHAMPAQWLGACQGGQADGLGVVRAGSAEPYRFFAGEAHAGRPAKGLIVTDDGWFAAAGFDTSGRRLDIHSGNPNDYHSLFLLAARAAHATARQFAAAGNAGSAAYYERLAKKIADGEPE